MLARVQEYAAEINEDNLQQTTFQTIKKNRKNFLGRF